MEGATEHSAVVQALIDDLIERGLDPAVPRLFIIDGSKALAKAIRRSFGRHTPIQRCQIPGGYVVRDANGQALAYIYSRDSEAEAPQAKVLTKDEARRIAVNIARLPELLGKGERD
jgi:hypothetical protein